MRTKTEEIIFWWLIKMIKHKIIVVEDFLLSIILDIIFVIIIPISVILSVSFCLYLIGFEDFYIALFFVISFCYLLRIFLDYEFAKPIKTKKVVHIIK